MLDNIEILKQAGTMISLMLLSFLPELFSLFKNDDRKLLFCFFCIVSKLALLYFFTSIFSSSFVSSESVLQ